VGLSMPEAYDVKNTWTYDGLPFLPDAKTMKYEVSDGKQKQFKVVKEAIEGASTVVVATDPDREGENIFYNIMKLCKSSTYQKPMKRLWINSLTDKEIIRGFSNLRDAKETIGYFYEANSRQIGDYLVGMNASPMYTLKLKEKGLTGVYSLGRVQTPVNTLIVENDLAIKNFKPENYKVIECETETTPKVVFKNKTEYFDDNEFQEVWEKHRLEEAKSGQIKNVEVSEKQQQSPKLFSLGGLQRYANSRWKYPTKKTDGLIQELYQKGYLSYPRTDSELITTNEHAYLVANLEAYKSFLNITQELPNTAPNKRYVDDNKVLEHYALIPTEKIPNLESLSADEKNIYLAVMERTILMFAKPYVYENTKVELDVNGLAFHAIGNVPKEMGWKSVLSFDEDEKEEEAKLPPFEVGEVVPSMVKKIVKVTKPPKQLTEGTLVGKGGLMDKLNLGTPATRSSVIETLLNRGYAKIEKNKIVPTAKGYLLWDLTKNKNLLIGDPEMTAKWEEYLSKISKGEGTQESFLNNIYKFLDSMINQLKEMDFESQYIREQVEATTKRVGDYTINEKAKVFEVTDAESHQFVIFKEFSGKKLTLKLVEELLANGKTKNPVKGLKSKSGKTYEAHLVFDRDSKKVKVHFENSGTDRPQATVKTVGDYEVLEKAKVFEVKKSGADESFIFFKSISGKEIDQKIVDELLLTGQTTDKVTGFTSKAGKKFDATLKFNSNSKKIEFVF